MVSIELDSTLSGPEIGKGAVLRLARGVADQVFLFFLCLAFTVVPLVVHSISPILAFASQFVLATGLVFFFSPAAPFVVIFSQIFQNMFVSMLSGYLSSSDDYNIIRGYNFFTAMVFWLWMFGHYGVNWRSYSRSVNRVMLACLVGFCLIGVYFLLGFAKNPIGASIYLRNIITPLVIFQIFLLATLKRELSVVPFFTWVTVLIIGLGYIEVFDRQLWIDLTNGWTLWDLTTREAVLNLVPDKVALQTGRFVVGMLDSMRVAFFNTPLLGEGLTVLRVNGPNGHPISYSYILAFLTVLMLTNKRWYLALLLAPLLLMASAKGALIMLFLAYCALLGRWLFGPIFAVWALVAVLLIYIFLGIITGLRIGDFHVLGFMGGLYNFIDYPLGNGIGDGGNLITDFDKLDWQAYQRAGRTPVAMESAVAALLHQMGFATFGLLAVYVWIAWQTYKVSFVSNINLHSITFYITLVALVNGIFQEEALFSPLALGVILGLNGFILGRSLSSRKQV
ncbi:hypothetical protein [uncultured Cohaesibacter sp.]|uniref:hypothetical protein n=1 Tax=uncultured Cohaesibacter sp. TaxID=1002546 RepID=UPI00292F8A9F|nr:hypothetical protein [uncultured Cohaesibacter sp.]